MSVWWNQLQLWLFLWIFWTRLILYVCVCVIRAPDQLIWLNHVVVVVQPWSGIDLVLVLCRLVIPTLIIAPRPTWLSHFLDSFRFVTSPSCQPPSSEIVVVEPLSYTCSPPPFLDRNAFHLYAAHTNPPTASAARSSPRAARLHLPLYPELFNPLFPLSSCTQVSVVPWGFARCGSLRTSLFRLPPCVLLRFLSSSGTWFLWVSFSH